MAKIELIMPKMGESITEATILKWNKNVGDKIEMDETVLEIATDKVDSEVPSPVEGTLVEILYNIDDVVPVDEVVAYIETDAAAAAASPAASAPEPKVETAAKAVPVATAVVETAAPATASVSSDPNKFYSPLVKNIAKKEGLSLAQLDTIVGSGKDNRVTKKDILAYIASPQPTQTAAPQMAQRTAAPAAPSAPRQAGANEEIVEMDRMRKMIADHMVRSVSTSPHVTSFVEADVTNLVTWRNKNKNLFIEKHGTKITFTPIILEAVTKAIVDFPMINVSVDGNNIIVKKDINIGMAAALPTGNLIVPVIKNADRLNLVGIAQSVNDLAGRARANKLKPDEVQGGTFTVTNVGTFGNVMGTPIINQPQVAILAAGAIRKMPAVVETEYGDVIAIRQKMFLSLSYDHRVVDGFLGGSFVRRVADYLEAFDMKRTV